MMHACMHACMHEWLLSKEAAFALLGNLAKSDSMFVPPDDFAKAVEAKKEGETFAYHPKPDP